MKKHRGVLKFVTPMPIEQKAEYINRILDVKCIHSRKLFTRKRNVIMWCPNGKSHPVNKEKDLISSNESISNERKVCMSRMKKRYYKYNLHYYKQKNESYPH